MKTSRLKRPSRPTPSLELTRLRARAMEAEETLRAIRSGEVDTVLAKGKQGPQVFTLQGAEHAYRILIESMNEGALTLATDKTILYANQHFAKMVKCPLEQVIGGSFRRFISEEDRLILKPLLKQAGNAGSKIQVLLNACDGSKVPAQISLCPLAKRGANHITIGMVVTDTTEAHRTEELLRALTHRVVQVQEAERGQVALELHDNITQLLCAVLVRQQAVTDNLSARGKSSMKEAMKLLEMLGKTATEVERISRNLRPSVLEHLGIVAVLKRTGAEFTVQTGISVQATCVELPERLPAPIELALYRIFQETLKNVEKHGRARNVAVSLTRQKDSIQLTIKDDGIGYDPDHPSDRRKQKGLGVLSMRERASYVGGILKVNSMPGAGTEIDVRIPIPLDSPPNKTNAPSALKIKAPKKRPPRLFSIHAGLK